jgi:uncharacterized protein Yka (UPF0111/DUF47 family)
MFSLQTMFGKGDRFYGLLEASAEAARGSAFALREMIATGPIDAPAMEAFAAAHTREKELATEISEALVNTFVTALDREDIESLSSALYTVPKTIQKFAERYAIVGERLDGVDFFPRAELLLRATDIMQEMVRELRNGLHLGRIRKLQDRLQAIESEADRLLLAPYNGLYLDNDDPIRAFLAKDLYEIMEKAVDRCRDVGNLIYAIVLKNS